MKIRGKFTLIQFIIIAGFIGSMAFVFVQFTKVYHLKQLEIQSLQTSASLKKLQLSTRLFDKRNKNVTVLWTSWEELYQQSSKLFIKMINSPYHKLLGKRSIERKNDLAEMWVTINTEEFLPLVEDVNTILRGDLPSILGDTGISTFRKLIGIRKEISNEQLENLIRMDTDFTRFRNSLESHIFLPTDRFIFDTSSEIERFSSRLYIFTISISLMIQAGGIFLVFLFTRSFSQNTILLEKTMAEVANGNFNINLEIKSGDEFENISRHFTALTQDLWRRIESMKDMMRDIGSMTGEEADIGELEDFILELAIDNTGADAGIFMSVEEGMFVLRKHQGYFPPPFDLPPAILRKREFAIRWFSGHRFAPGEGILGEILVNAEPRFVRDNHDGELANNAVVDSDNYINSAIFIPLTVSGNLIGLMALALTRRDSVFTDMDYAYMRSYGEFISLTLDNLEKYHELLKSHQVNREIEVAADIQRALLPSKLPNMKNAEVAAYSDAAKGVSGDYYDVFDLGEGKTALVICDVSGKGVPASLLMIMIRTIIRSISSAEKHSNQILQELNRAVTGRMGADRFATISIIIIDSAKGIVSYSNGAHHPLYILRGGSGKYRMFDTDGLPLGIDIKATFGHKKIRVHKNDYLILFTDGLPEARSPEGEELGTERLLRFIARHAAQNPVELTRRVKDFIEDFTSGAKHDDQTFVALKIG